MKKRNKIAIFSGEIPSSTFIEHLIDGIAKEHSVFLFGVLESPKTYRSKSINIYKTPFSHWHNLLVTLYRLLLLLFKSPKDIVLLAKEVKRYKRLYDKWIWYSKFLPIILYRPDVFHMQWTRDLEFYAFLKTTFKIPMVVSLRGAHVHYTPIVAPYIADVYRSMFPKIDAFHAVSHAMSIEAQRYGADVSKIKVIHSPLPQALLKHYQPLKKSKGQAFKIGAVGRFHWIKGMRYVFDACAILQDRSFDYQFSFVSSNAINEDSLFQLHQLGISEHVTLTPSLEQQALFELMKGFDVLVLSSINEGIANVVLEAMALGIPVISTDCGGMPEVVMPNETGWLVPIRDAQAIADAIIDVSETSEAEILRITQNAHDFVTRHFNAEVSIEKFLGLYETISPRH